MRYVKNAPNKCSKGICNAWHFHYALVLVFKVTDGGIAIALLTS
ncbi:DUF3265 domain-containing protein [Vibrio sp. SCSIO 43133]|nr:DUF3265 domain-containing protein [Vibrio sp. SCSIO 43133]USE03353.1 DUF3265 domain-containing protein [Vibrio sp. SCSIO 43133]